MSKKVGLIIQEKEFPDRFFNIPNINFNICNLIKLGVDEIYISGQVSKNFKFLSDKFNDKIKIENLIISKKKITFEELLYLSIVKLSYMNYDEKTDIVICDSNKGMFNTESIDNIYKSFNNHYYMHSLSVIKAVISENTKNIKIDMLHYIINYHYQKFLMCLNTAQSLIL